MPRAKTKGDMHQHFHKRLVERYKATASRKEIERAIKQIQDGKSTVLGKISNRVSNHAVTMMVTDLDTLKQKEIIVVVGYDSRRKALATALPNNQASPQIENLAPSRGATGYVAR